MLLKEYIPKASLRKYIHRYLIVSSPEAMPAERCVMDGFIKLFLFLNEDTPEYYDREGRKKNWGDGVGSHQTDRDLFIRTPDNLKLVLCIFKPFGFFRLFRVPIHLLNNNIVPLETFLGSRTREFKEKIVLAPTDQEKIAVLDDFFTALTRPLHIPYRSAVGYAQDVMLQKNGLVSIDSLSKDMNLSARSLERYFLENVGMAPKYYARVLRFNYAFGLKRADPRLDWFDIIHHCRYFDQTHFIKDFRHFTDQPPVAFYSTAHPIEEVYVGRVSDGIQ